MSPQENIKDELNLLGANLPYPAHEPEYRVPAGYFENFADNVMNRIRHQEELEELSPLLNSVSREMPYSTPGNYFDSIVIPVSANEEELPDLLIGLKNKSTYQVPENYFELLPERILQQVQIAQPAKLVSLGKRNWLRYAAAAMLTGIMLTAGLLIYNAQKSVGPVAWIEKNTKKVSAEEINSLIELTKTDSTISLVQSTAAEDVKSLVKDISDKEIQDFLKETELDDTGADDVLILN